MSIIIIACNNLSKEQKPKVILPDFDPTTLNQNMVPSKLVSGQLLYFPVYSNFPFQIDTIKFDMSAFIAIHNTDLNFPITLTKVLYFNQNGRLVNDYLNTELLKIAPLATKEFHIPYEDQSGTGANFLIEWTSDTLVNEPLIESITASLKPNSTFAVLSRGKILSEKK